MKTEPSLTIGAAISGLIAAGILLLVALGVDITPGVATAVDAFVGSLLALAPFIASYFIRNRVVSPDTAEEMVLEAHGTPRSDNLSEDLRNAIPGVVISPGPATPF